MNSKLTKALLLLVLIVTINLNAQTKTVEFLSTDSLKITADLYLQNNDKSTPFIILFHRARWSRGEYIEIAPKLNKLGFNCMAIDQRSGDTVNEIPNETSKRAQSKGLKVDYIDTYPDLLAAIDYAKTNYAKGKLIIWGSSYSSSLVLYIAGQRNDIDGVLAFSPRESFECVGKPSNWVGESAKNISVPVFITSAKGEEANWKPIFKNIRSSIKQSFIPETEGNHGSRALWSEFDDSSEYWKAVEEFLKFFDG